MEERVYLKGRVGTEVMTEQDGRRWFKINTSLNGRPKWWRIELSTSTDELTQRVRKGVIVQVEGSPEFLAWTKKNKKGNAVTVEGQAEVFIRRVCITEEGNITFL